MHEDELYKKSWDGPLLSCVSTEDIPKILAECNGQVEVMNRILFKGIKKNMIQRGSKKEAWIDKLPVFLWSLRKIPSHATWKTPFSLVYVSKAVLPAEVGLPTYRQIGFDKGELRDRALYKM
ncbi:hypothetical protein LIER_22968 [Lithospermum erythrorhizon]|uniref:Reverse transcriptase n=1 Tax=Lithospermum erythrorhizon TaxID=34254 RepID=A0AAV3QZ59_LITER